MKEELISPETERYEITQKSHNETFMNIHRIYLNGNDVFKFENSVIFAFFLRS